MNIVVWITSKDSEVFAFNDSNAQRLKSLIPDASIINCKSTDEFKSNLKDADIALVWVFKHEWFALAPKLKWIATPAAGKDAFNYEMPEGVLKTHGSFHGVIMAETVMGMMLSLSRGILDAVRWKDEMMWPRKELTPGMNMLRGSHLLIIGFGSIGYQIAKLAKAFGMRITGVKRRPADKPDFFDEKDVVITVDKLDDAIANADHIVLVLPNESSTDDMMDEHRISLMKKSACIYNVGRGNSIDEKALVSALKERRIKAAFLDVFKTEPLPEDSELRRCPGFYILPHASAISPEYMDLFADEFAREYEGWIKK